ncbi:MAG: ATP synthase F1 subunit delta [Acidobacteriia bacterium]|nr:ATP synthase F1 subunit delta [Terriglobia bacterium]
MTVSGIAARYAEALADIVTAAGSPLRAQDAVAELVAFEGTIKSSPELYNALTSPAVPNSRKRAVIGRIGDDLQLSKITRNFLFVLIDHSRLPLLPGMLEAFEAVLDERLGFARAEIASPRELNPEQRAALSAALERLTGKRIRMRFRVEESLIGGVVARIGSTIYDGSVRGQLRSLEHRLIAQD